MAGLKKPVKKRDNNNPNTVLVVFLVLFVLLSIGLGVWGYYGYQGQEELKKKAIDAGTSAKVAKDVELYFAYITRELRLAIGQELDADEKTAWKTTREDFMKDDGKFAKESTREAVKKLIDEMKKELTFDDAASAYVSNYKARLALLSAEVAKSKQEAEAQLRARKAADDRFKTLVTQMDTFHANANKKIQDGNAIALAASSKRSKEMEMAILQNEKLLEEIRKNQDIYELKKEELTLANNKLLQEIQTMRQQKKDAPLANPRGPGLDPHALLLDISQGKPLWDAPLGKITRVETQDRQVAINLGFADGVKSGLTFMVFAPGWNGRADKELKGTIEVIRVLDTNTSLARLTSLYDGNGHEIPLNDPTKGRLQRESENPIKEGDLLFNVFWGTHVAISGPVNLNDFSASSPAEQMRNLNQFMQLLQRQGVIIDAYLDLTDGTIKGAITARTRFLVSGEPRRLGGQKPAMDKEGGEVKPLAVQEKAGDGAQAVDQQRVQLVDEAMKAMRNEAIDRGMFIISAENYANVTGYRRPRSANSLETSGFRPALPAAVSIPPLILDGANNPARDEK